jgi:hypothetical protein
MTVSTKVDLFMDGDQWCALMGDRETTNIQESPCGFGETPGEALARLGIALTAKQSDAYPRLQGLAADVFDQSVKQVVKGNT